MTHKSTSSHPKTTRSVLAKAAAAGLLAALPIGVIAPAAAAETVSRTEHVYPYDTWQQDCDHDGAWMWQQNRGNWEWGNCNMNIGHWEWRHHPGQWGRYHDRDGWQWHHDRDDGHQHGYPQHERW